MPLRYRARKVVKLGPLHLNFTQNGLASYSLVLGRLRWNSVRGWSFDTPGPGGVTFGEPPARRRRAS